MPKLRNNVVLRVFRSDLAWERTPGLWQRGSPQATAQTPGLQAGSGLLLSALDAVQFLFGILETLDLPKRHPPLIPT